MLKKLTIVLTIAIFGLNANMVVASSSDNANGNGNNDSSNSLKQWQKGYNKQTQGQSSVNNLSDSNDQRQQQGMVGNNAGDGNGIGNDNSNTVYDAAVIPVATAYAPALTTSNDTCMGSTSIGAQGLLIGLSFGTTWTDDDCITRKDARFVHNAGHRIVALSLMCGKEAVRAAVARAGSPEQRAACSITEDEIDDYRAKPIIVSVDRIAPAFDEDEE